MATHFSLHAWRIFLCIEEPGRLQSTELHKGGVICISEVIDISPGNLESILCFIQPGISHDVLCMWVGSDYL